MTRRETLFGLAGAAIKPAPNRPLAAFHYAAVFPESAVDWYTRFEIIVTGGILSRAQSSALRKSKLVAYEWSSGFYPGDSVSAALDWQQQVKSHPDWLLTGEPIGGAAAEAGKTAHWYDFGSSALIAARAAHLKRVVAESAYDGFFFDTPGFEQIPKPAQAAFRSRHKEADYNQRQGHFFKALRLSLPRGKIIFLNQGYRHAAEMLPYADYDLTESYFTYAGTPQGTGFRPWNDAAKPWESIKTPLAELILKPQARYPKVRFVHVNYAAGPPEILSRARRYSYAAARIFNHHPYLIAPADWRSEIDGIYFTNLGKPLTASYVEDPASGAVWRAFEGGVVAINGGAAQASIPAGELAEPLQGYVFPA